MPKAEVGSTKHLSNKMKSKGLQRLRWYCQICEKQCRDENGFKMHTQSESHVRQMMIVGEDPKKYIEDFSRQFLRDFMQLLKTSHGEKQVHINHFYQDYIHNKDHVRMNATKWPSLTEFAKYLGREGICRVEETDKGLHIQWIDDSPEALRRKDAVRRKEMQDKGDEEREQRMIREQIRRARKAGGGGAEEDGAGGDEAEDDSKARELRREELDKIKLSFGAKPATPENAEAPTKPPSPDAAEAPSASSSSSSKVGDDAVEPEAAAAASASQTASPAPEKPAAAAAAPISLKMSAKPPQAKNVFAVAKKNALSGQPKKTSAFEQPKQMSQAERIMREEMERKRSRPDKGGSGSGIGFSFSNKRQKM